MAEHIADGNGNGDLLVVNSDGSINISNHSTIKRSTGTITVTSGTGSVALTDVNIKSTYLGVSGPNKTNETFTITITDTDTGLVLSDFNARSNNSGNARSKSIGIPLTNITIDITSASVDGTYTYLVMG
jgi:hypothetical protein